MTSIRCFQLAAEWVVTLSHSTLLNQSRQLVAEVEEVGAPISYVHSWIHEKSWTHWPQGRHGIHGERHRYHSEFPEQVIRFPNTSRWPETGTPQALGNPVRGAKLQRHDR